MGVRQIADGNESQKLTACRRILLPQRRWHPLCFAVLADKALSFPTRVLWARAVGVGGDADRRFFPICRSTGRPPLQRVPTPRLTSEAWWGARPANGSYDSASATRYNDGRSRQLWREYVCADDSPCGQIRRPGANSSCRTWIPPVGRPTRHRATTLPPRK